MKKLFTRISLLVALLLAPLACGRNDLLPLIEQEEQQTKPDDTDKQDDKKDDDTPGEGSGEDKPGEGGGDEPGEGGGDEPGEGGGDEPGEGGGDEPGEGGGDEPGEGGGDEPGEGGGDEPGEGGGDEPGEGGGDEPDQPATGPQLYNLNFDEWCEIDTRSGKRWACYGENANEEQQSIWDTPNCVVALPWGTIAQNCVFPETERVAIPGEGKAAAKIMSISQVAKTPGALFTGVKYCTEKTGGFVEDDLKKLLWGVEFHARPKTLDGFFCYEPKQFGVGGHPGVEDDEYDKAHLIVLLSSEQILINTETSNKVVLKEEEYATDRRIIGYGKVVWDGIGMEEYEPFSLTITYNDNRTPDYITIVATSSYLGEDMISAEGSTLWLDELELKY